MHRLRAVVFWILLHGMTVPSTGVSQETQLKEAILAVIPCPYMIQRAEPGKLVLAEDEAPAVEILAARDAGFRDESCHISADWVLALDWDNKGGVLRTIDRTRIRG